MPGTLKTDSEMKKEYLNNLGIKAKDLGKANADRVYTELLEYQKSGRIPDYLM